MSDITGHITPLDVNTFANDELKVKAKPSLFDVQPKTITDRRVEALSELQKLHEDFADLTTDYKKLTQDFNRMVDRANLMEEERDRYRTEALIFRTRLIRLATIQSSIGLLTTDAQSIMTEVVELTAQPTLHPDEIEKLAESLNPKEKLNDPS